MSTENPLQKKVFEACDYLQQTGEEITRDKYGSKLGGVTVPYHGTLTSGKQLKKLQLQLQKVAKFLYKSRN